MLRPPHPEPPHGPPLVRRDVVELCRVQHVVVCVDASRNQEPDDSVQLHQQAGVVLPGLGHGRAGVPDVVDGGQPLDVGGGVGRVGGAAHDVVGHGGVVGGGGAGAGPRLLQRGGLLPLVALVGQDLHRRGPNALRQTANHVH